MGRSDCVCSGGTRSRYCMPYNKHTHNIYRQLAHSFIYYNSPASSVFVLWANYCGFFFSLPARHIKMSCVIISFISYYCVCNACINTKLLMWSMTFSAMHFFACSVQKLWVAWKCKQNIIAEKRLDVCVCGWASGRYMHGMYVRATICPAELGTNSEYQLNARSGADS